MTKNLRYFARQRIEFIEDFLSKQKHIRRKNIMEKFGVSEAQASLDLQLYRKLFPAKIRYDLSRRIYLLNVTSTSDCRIVGRTNCKWCAPENSQDPPKWCRAWEGCKIIEEATAMPETKDARLFDEAKKAFRIKFGRDPSTSEADIQWIDGCSIGMSVSDPGGTQVAVRESLDAENKDRKTTNELLDRIARALERKNK